MTSDDFSLFSLGRSVWTDLRGAWRQLVLFQVGFKLLEAWLLVPLIAVLMAAVLRRAGHFAVSNQDIRDFLLSPLGLVYGMVFSTIAVSLFLVEQAGMMAVVSASESDNRATWKSSGIIPKFAPE
jgi:glycerophosphoryl diester phosphodiesterase